MSNSSNLDTCTIGKDEMEKLLAERPLPTSAELIDSIRRTVAQRGDALVETVGRISYDAPGGPMEYETIKVRSAVIDPDDRILLIRAGIHGNEVSGPLSLRDHLDEILDYAHQRGLKLIIYPLDNPSGFEARLRYNVEGDRGAMQDGNNDFMRYELADGSITGDLLDRPVYSRWYWASDPALWAKLGYELRLPKETELMHEDLKRSPLSQVSAVVDLHQDNFCIGAGSTGMSPGAYHYAFGDVSRYSAIADEIARHVPLLADTRIGSGFFGPASAVTAGAVDSDLPLSDSRGFIVRHDGTLPDLLLKFGAEHGITVETTGATSPEAADQANMIWIRGVLDLMARS